MSLLNYIFFQQRQPIYDHKLILSIYNISLTLSTFPIIPPPVRSKTLWSYWLLYVYEAMLDIYGNSLSIFYFVDMAVKLKLWEYANHSWEVNLHWLQVLVWPGQNDNVQSSKMTKYTNNIILTHDSLDIHIKYMWASYLPL